MKEDHLLDTLYERWLKWDGSGMEALSYCIEKFVGEQLREPVHFACQIGENYFSIHVTDEGYNFNFYDENYNLIDGGVYDEWGPNDRATMDSVVKEIGANWGELPGANLLCDYKTLPTVDYGELWDKSDAAAKTEFEIIEKSRYMQEINTPDVRLTANSEGISVEGFIGTWYVIDVVERDGKSYYLLEHEEYGDDANPIFVDKEGTLVLDCARNGAEDLDYFLESENDDLEPDC